MKIARRVICLCAITLFSAPFAQAQFDFDELLEYKDEANFLVGSYLSPAMKSLSLSLNQGWYNTAKPHKIAGIDITFTANAMYFPASERSYFIDNSAPGRKLELISGPGGAPVSGSVPTVFGSEQAPWYRVKDNPTTEFEGPPGIDLKENIKIDALPVPMVQIGFGLPKNTDLKVRFVPTLDLGDEGTFNLIGVGVMHDIKQHIPGIKLLPFDLSAFAGYTMIKVNADLSSAEVKGEDQIGEFKMTALTIQGVISKKLSVLTVYGGVGYNVATSRLGVSGWYDFDEDQVRDDGEVNPLALDYAASGPRVTAGFRLKLAILTLHADYTLQKYRSLTAGIGISIR